MTIVPDAGGLIMKGCHVPAPGRRPSARESPVPASPYVICLDDAGRAELESASRRATAPFRLVQRARIVLLAADGVSNTEIAKRVGVSRPTVIDWRTRYERSGMTGLDDEPRSGRPRQVDHDAIITATLTPLVGRQGLLPLTLVAARCRVGED